MPKDAILKDEITFTRLTGIDPAEIAAHMSDPRVAEHMPLLTFEWDAEAAAKFVAHKEQCWARDGLGHWAFLANGRYVGWGGFQKEDSDWDFGLVLKPEFFGLGLRITRQALEFARSDPRIASVTFLLAPSRRSFKALERLGARPEGAVTYDGRQFLRYRLATS